ncbi:MAG: ferroxidase, partial [Desulfofundulus sp.]
NGKMVSLTDYLAAGEIGAIEYRFRALRPGAYLYESGTNSAKQVQMGLYGVIVVRPVGYHQPGHPNFRTAYGQNTASRHDIEKILVLGEIDSAMHKSVVPGAEYNLLDFRPDHWVINGRTFPASIAPDDDSSQPYGSAIRCRLGQRVLLRILNAGFQAHTLALGALTGRVIAEDAYPLKIGSSDATYEKTAVTVGPGQSLDLLVTPPYPGEFYIYDREYRHLVNDNQFPGGMMTKIAVTP